MAAPPIAIGDVLAGKYVIERAIGEGGMGIVFAARHRELEQRVAIKFLLPEFAEQGMAAERFRREARAAARMRGEHICRVLDVGTLDTGIPFMVMEYLEGRDLASELDRRGQLPVEEAVGYVLEACEALAEAHVAGIIHRDLKPANLFLETRADGSRRIKVLDFGVSKLLLSLSENGALTKTSSLVGSPLYMSPEQLDSAKDVDARTDVWALGVVLFELLTGNTPFRGETIPQLVAAVLQDAPVRFPQLAVPLPPGLAEVVSRTLAKQRDKRYASVAELAQALAPYAPPSARESISRISRLLGPRPSGADAGEPSVRVVTAGAMTPRADGDSRAGTAASGDRAAPVSGRKLVWAIAALVALVAATARFVSWRGAAARTAAAPSADAQPTGQGTQAAPSAPAQARAPDPEPGPAAQAAPIAPGAVLDATTAPPSAAQAIAPNAEVAPTPAKELAPASDLAPPTAAPARARPTPEPSAPRATRPRAEQSSSVAPPEAVPVEAPKPGHGQRDLSDFGGRR